MGCEIENLVKIVTGSYKKFTVTLTDEDTGDRLDLTDVQTASIVILTGTGATITKTITTPIADPKVGIVTIELDEADTVLLDKDTKSFELELIDSVPNTSIYIGKNLLEVTERLKPL